MVVVAVYAATFVADLGDMVVGDASYLDLQTQVSYKPTAKNEEGKGGRGDLDRFVARPCSWGEGPACPSIPFELV